MLSLILVLPLCSALTCLSLFTGQFETGAEDVLVTRTKAGASNFATPGEFDSVGVRLRGTSSAETQPTLPISQWTLASGAWSEVVEIRCGHSLL